MHAQYLLEKSLQLNYYIQTNYNDLLNICQIPSLAIEQRQRYLKPNGFMPDAPVHATCIRLLPRILRYFRDLLLAPLHLNPFFSKLHRLLQQGPTCRLFGKVALYLITSNLY